MIFIEKGKLNYGGPLNNLLKNNEERDYEITLLGELRNRSCTGYLTERGEGYIYNVPEKMKDNFLREVYKENIIIDSLTRSQLTLEDVIYTKRS